MAAASPLAWLQLMRAPAMFTAVSNLLAAHWLVTGGNYDPRALLLLTLSGTTLYIAGMVLNDCFDLSIDGRERPYRPLPSGRISPSSAWTVGWLCLGTGILLAVLHGPESALIAAALAVAILTYNRWSKTTWLGPFNMGLCRYLNWLLGLSAVGLTTAVLPIALPVFFYVTALTFVSRIEADASTRLPLAGSALCLVLAAGMIGYLFYAGVLVNIAAPALAGIGLLLVLTRLRKTWQAFTPASAQATVAFMLFGIIPLDALMLSGAGLPWAALALLVLMVPGHILGRWMYVT